MIDYGRESYRPFPWRRFLKIAAVVLVSAVLLWSAVYYGYVRPRADRWQCHNTLSAIGQAAQLYRQDHQKQGINAPDLQALQQSQSIPPEIFSCPAGGAMATLPTSMPMAQRRAAMSNPYSYIYVAACVPVNAPPMAVWMLEDPANHGMTGGHVLYADGHVAFVPLAQLMPCFNDLAAGRNPPTSPAVTTSAAHDDYDQHWRSRMPLLKTGVWLVPATQPAR